MHAYLFSPTFKTCNDSTLPNLRQVEVAFTDASLDPQPWQPARPLTCVLKWPRRKYLDRQESDAEEIRRWRSRRLRQRAGRSIGIHLDDGDRRHGESPF